MEQYVSNREGQVCMKFILAEFSVLFKSAWHWVLCMSMHLTLTMGFFAWRFVNPKRFAKCRFVKSFWDSKPLCRRPIALQHRINRKNASVSFVMRRLDNMFTLARRHCLLINYANLRLQKLPPLGRSSYGIIHPSINAYLASRSNWR